MLAPFLILLLFAVAPTAGDAQGSCPADHRTSRAITERFLTHPGFAAERRQAGLQGFGPADVRLLTDAADAAVCRRLAPGFSPAAPAPGQTAWEWSAYEVGPYYVVTWRSVHADGAYHMEWVPLILVGRDFEQVAAFAM